ncbi:MAG TPA: hypothetical protein VGQ59_10410 [Cyclobacteriaceae bacterium]|jgi:hypothetical protein|nr:hypothetical protein [Cyclobacteriaceae bacterium]
MKVIFSSNGTGPYTIHEEGNRFLLISHRGPKIHVVGKSEEEVVSGIKERIGDVRIEEYPNNVYAYGAILEELKDQKKSH